MLLLTHKVKKLKFEPNGNEQPTPEEAEVPANDESQPTT